MTVGLQQLHVAELAIGEQNLVGLVLRQPGYLDGLDLAIEGLHLFPPLDVELVPVLEVIARALLEELGPLGNQVRVGDRVGRDVDVAVDHAIVDAHRGRHGEGPVLPAGEGEVRDVHLAHVEGGHRQREVHRVPEPEPVLVSFLAVLVEQGPVRIHLLPALAAGGGLDREGTGECTHLGCRGCHRSLLRWRGREKSSLLVCYPRPPAEPSRWSSSPSVSIAHLSSLVVIPAGRQRLTRRARRAGARRARRA